ncbi:hypothetical protein NPIL_131631 [Nephila pilipes]|uniref:Uncharacterized protein n=1 Tax=Nephila pilipes TaxID=299642 RepID=A0A8X6QK74_NEPPI|nr:hypothetical protein NPIL_131631 [Nephila pilipes]
MDMGYLKGNTARMQSIWTKEKRIPRGNEVKHPFKEVGLYLVHRDSLSVGSSETRSIGIKKKERDLRRDKLEVSETFFGSEVWQAFLEQD